MPPGSDKWIRSINDNPAGKVVTDPEGNRWQWETDDDTVRLLKTLQNDELAIEQTDLVLNPAGQGARDDAESDQSGTADPKQPKPLKKLGARDAGGGFDPYDNSSKIPRR